MDHEPENENKPEENEINDIQLHKQSPIHYKVKIKWRKCGNSFRNKTAWNHHKE